MLRCCHYSRVLHGGSGRQHDAEVLGTTHASFMVVVAVSVDAEELATTHASFMVVVAVSVDAEVVANDHFTQDAPGSSQLL